MDTSSIRRSEYILEAAVAERGMPLRRLRTATLRTEFSVLFFARAGMAAFKFN
jgi:hypothetical protein